MAGEVRTRSFSLADSGGRDRAVIAMSVEGSPTLVLYDAAGQRQLALGVSLKSNGGVPEVWIANEKGEVIWNKRR